MTLNSTSGKSAGTNVDPEEIRKFSAMASQWWDKNGKFKPLHDMNPVRLSYIEQHYGALAERKVLDVGCGGGILSESMALRGAEVTGIDLGQAPLEVAGIHAAETGVSIDYQKITAEQLAREKPGHFDVVTCMEMLEHVPDPSAIVQACAHLVKPGGHIFYSTINRNPKSWLFAIAGAEYILKLLPRGTHIYDRFIKPHELVRWCRQANTQLLDTCGIIYNPVTKNFRLSPKDVSVNYLVHTQKPSCSVKQA